MKLAEFFEYGDNYPFAQALNVLREALDRHADKLPDGQRYSPWTLCLGKGGPRPDGGGHYPSAEQSLYRHCMEVAVYAAWLFHHAWRAEKLPLAPGDDPVPALRRLLAIAFAHDADKYVGGRSRSPSLDDVRVIHGELEMARWSGLTAEQLHAAVSRVENRGLGQALFGQALLDGLTDKLAELVGVADNLLSRAARQGGLAGDFLALHNQDLERLRAIYGIPRSPLRLVTWRHDPIVLQQLQDHLNNWFAASDHYPLILTRQGGRLEVAVTDDIPLPAWLDRFESRLAEAEPSLKVAATTGSLTLFHVHGAQDLITGLQNAERQTQLLLRVNAKDWDVVTPLVHFWVMHCGAPLAVAPRKGSLCPVVKTSAEIPAGHPFWRAAALAAVQALAGTAATESLLALDEGKVATGLRHNGIAPESLRGPSLRTAVALQAALLLPDEALEPLLDTLHGAWPERCDIDPGARAIVDRLRTQIGLGSVGAVDAPPYQAPPRGGTCLLCGMATEQPIETNRMRLAGIKATSFYNGINHQKTLWAERGENYLCPACLRIQGLLVQQQPGLRANPMLIATPVRHLLDTRAMDVAQELLRSYDAVAKEGWRKILPWHADARFDQPLLFEERPVGLVDTVDQMHRLARYAVLSGEPVHAFVARQRSVRAAFLYEPMPEILQELLHDQLDADGGVSRAVLAPLLDRLELFKAMLAENEGLSALQVLPRLGWWAAAFVFLRAALRQKDGWGGRARYFVELAREAYPMNEYDQWLEQLITQAVETHRPRRDASGAEWTLMLRVALDTYQKHYAFGPVATRDAIAQQLRAYLLRREANLNRKDFDERLQAFAESACALLMKADQEYNLDSSFTRFLFAAYEGGLRRAVGDYWKQRDGLTNASATTETAP